MGSSRSRRQGGDQSPRPLRAAGEKRPGLAPLRQGRPAAGAARSRAHPRARPLRRGDPLRIRRSRPGAARRHAGGGSGRHRPGGNRRPPAAARTRLADRPPPRCAAGRFERHRPADHRRAYLRMAGKDRPLPRRGRSAGAHGARRRRRRRPLRPARAAGEPPAAGGRHLFAGGAARRDPRRCRGAAGERPARRRRRCGS